MDVASTITRTTNDASNEIDSELLTVRVSWPVLVVDLDLF